MDLACTHGFGLALVKGGRWCDRSTQLSHGLLRFRRLDIRCDEMLGCHIQFSPVIRRFDGRVDSEGRDSRGGVWLCTKMLAFGVARRYGYKDWEIHIFPSTAAACVLGRRHWVLKTSARRLQPIFI